MPIPVAVQVGFIVATYAGNYLQRWLNKPKVPKPEKTGTWPESGIGKTIPVVFGLYWVPAEILWYGNVKATKVYNGAMPVGYSYDCGIHWGVCHAPITAVFAIKANGVTLWGNDWGPDVLDNPTSPIYVTTPVYINKPTAFGGAYQGGGVIGRCDVEFGDSAQTENAYLASAQGGSGIQPAYRGIVGAVFYNTAGGYSPALIASMHFEIRQWSFLVQALYGHAPALGGLVPTEIIEQAWTNPAWGMGKAPDDLDATSFAAAEAVLESEGMYLSYLWDASEPVDNLLKVVMAHIQGVLYRHPTTGKVTLKLIRNDYTVSNLPVLDETNLIRVESFARPSVLAVPNTLIASYVDSGGTLMLQRDWQQRSFTLVNGAALAAAGNRPNAVEMEYSMITEASIAETVANRDLKRLSTPLATAVLVGNRDLASLCPGDPFVFSWPAYGITSCVMRVSSIDYGTVTEGEVRIDAVEDMYSGGVATDAVRGGTGWTSPLRHVISIETVPPGAPTAGDSYLIGVGATGAWAGHDGEIATWDGSQWVFVVAEEGELVLVGEEETAYRLDEDGDWVVFVDGTLVRWPTGIWTDPWVIGAGQDLSYIWRHATGALMYKSAALPGSDDDGVEFGFGGTVETIP